MITFDRLSESYRYAIDVKDLKRQILNDYNVSLSISGKDIVVIDKIKIPESERGQGIGTEIMQHIIDWADENFVILALTPSSDLGGNKAKLKTFYKRFDFIDNKGRNKMYEISETMYREPQ
jgi:GNAT superfamily N-acetyltransferase